MQPDAGVCVLTPGGIGVIRLSDARRDSMLAHMLGMRNWLLCMVFGGMEGNWL